MKRESKEAKILALLNAGAFIEGHGEEGGIDQNDYDCDVELYLRECKKVAKMLYAKADKLQSTIKPPTND